MGTDAKIPGGYVLLSRALLDSTLWGCGPDALRVATHILLTARHNYKPKKYDGFHVCRGEVVTSFADIAEGTQWHENRKVRQYSRQKVQRLVEQLERIGFCKRKSDTYGTHLTVCNYEAYQNADNYKSDSCGTTPDTTRTAPGTYNKGEECKNENNDNTPQPPKGGAARFDEFWKIYPVKKSKKPARDKWVRKKLDSIADQILADVQKRQQEDRQWREGYIPHPSTYLSREGWQDDIDRGGQQPGNLTLRAADLPD